jgi:dipeptidyl aminopeptidase/acylaminoacyl peptidase
MRSFILAGLFLACVGGAACAAPLTVVQALQPTGAKTASLSPDGKHVAIVFFNGYTHELQIYDTETGQSKVLSFSRQAVEGFWRYLKAPRDVTWAGNDLLAVDYGIEAESINLDGKKVAELGEAVIARAERDKPESPWLLVYTDVDDGEIAKVNARTGQKKKFSYPSGKVMNWAFDRSGELRAVTLVNSAFWRDVSTVSNWYRPAAGAAWEKLAEFGIADDYWTPMFVPDEPNTLAVSSRIGRDTYAIFSYDTARRQIGEMMAGHPTQDILGAAGLDQASFERVSTRGMRVQHVWFDSAWASAQQSVDLALPGHSNVLSGDPRGKMLVYSHSDLDPGIWYLVDMGKGQLRLLARRIVSTKDVTMRPMEIMQYAADDGTSIPAFLTRPADGAQASPLIVLIHGGPKVRDYWDWNPEVQILAAQGYAVFQPQFRGSSGFGKKFEQAGFGQWGLAMQDDITAGVRELIRQGIADPARICIVGASYGGYAALWGLAKTPELYRCGVSFAGVADIDYMLNDNSDSAGDKVTRELMLTRIGNPRADREKFDQVSPLKHAARIAAPVLLMHGEEDRRVPIAHGRKMKQALESAGKQVEWLSFEEEGHGLRYIANEKKYFDTMLSFLEKYLGKPAVKSAPE